MAIAGPTFGQPDFAQQLGAQGSAHAERTYADCREEADTSFVLIVPSRGSWCASWRHKSRMSTENGCSRPGRISGSSDFAWKWALRFRRSCPSSGSKNGPTDQIATSNIGLLIKIRARKADCPVSGGSGPEGGTQKRDGPSVNSGGPESEGQFGLVIEYWTC